MDYLEHPDSRHMTLEKVEEHIPQWYQAWQEEKRQFQIHEGRGTSGRKEAAGRKEPPESAERTDTGDTSAFVEPDLEKPVQEEPPMKENAGEGQVPLALDTPIQKRERMKTAGRKPEGARITRVEDLFADQTPVGEENL